MIRGGRSHSSSTSTACITEYDDHDMKIIVTGAAGLIGCHLTRKLLEDGHDVVGIDDFSGGRREFVHPDLRLLHRDVVDHESLDRVFEGFRPEVVFHLAAIAAVGLSPFIRRRVYTTNVIGSANVINSALNHGTRKVVFTSSMDVYGSQDAPFTEEMHPMPEDPYGISKRAIECDLENARRQFGLEYTIVRPHNVFGRYQNIWDRYRNVLGIWIRQTLEGKPITIYGDGSQVRSFSDVRYYMDPFAKLLKDGDGEVYNIGADEHVTILDASRRFMNVARSRGHAASVVHLEPRDEVRVAHCVHDKAKRDLGFKDETDFEALIDDMFAWAETQPVRSASKVPYEVTRGMYSYWRLVTSMEEHDVRRMIRESIDRSIDKRARMTSSVPTDWTSFVALLEHCGVPRHIVSSERMRDVWQDMSIEIDGCPDHERATLWEELVTYHLHDLGPSASKTALIESARRR